MGTAAEPEQPVSIPPPRRSVDIIGIGGTKCGSTSLWAVLKSQPWFAGASIKETRYFAEAFARGEDWYAGLFPTSTDGLLAGEVTPAYLTTPETPARIRAHSPDARLFAILRDPVDRFSSHVTMLRGAGRLDGRTTIAEVLSSNRWPRIRENLLDFGAYARHLARYSSYFPAEQVRVIFLEEVRSDPARHLAPFLAWVAPGHRSIVPTVLPHWNPAFSPWSRRIDTALLRLRTAMISTGAIDHIDRVESARRLLSRPAPSASESLDDSSREALAEHYRPLNADLEDLLGRAVPEVWT